MGHDATWVVVVIFTKSAFFISVKMTMSTDKLVEHYMYNIASCMVHLKPYHLIEMQDLLLVRNEFHEAMVTKLKLSTTFHSQIEGQSERTIQILEDLLRSCILYGKGSWEDHVH